MTTLSPRLAHLLIHEDRATGRLINADGTDAGGIPGLYPPLSPMTFAFEPSPLDKPLPLPSPASLLPPLLSASDRRPSQSIFSLVSDLHMTPPSSASSTSSAPLQASQADSRRLSPSHFISSLPTTSCERHEYYSPYRPSSGNGPMRPRPEMVRRHSSNPYEYPPPGRHNQYALPPNSEAFAPMSGSRAPISRTTKACNACRSRKVRCDAGGLPGGEPSTCNRCRESGVACVYSGTQKKRGPCPG